MKLLAQSLQIPDVNGNYQTINGPANFSFTDIGMVVTKIIPFTFAFAGLALLLMIIASGLGLMTSAGDAKKTEASKQRLTYAIVGFFIIFAAYWLVRILGIIFGFEDFKIFL